MVSRRLPSLYVRAMPKSISFELPVGHDHDIGGLDVAKDDRWVLGVQELQHFANLDAVLEGFFFVHRLAVQAVQLLFERFAGDELHHQIGTAALGEEIGHAGQVVVVQLTENLRFAPESFQELALFLFFAGSLFFAVGSRVRGACSLDVGAHLFDRHVRSGML